MRRSTRGVTLIEMLIVVTLIALVAGLMFPSLSAGLDSLRLRSTSDQIVSFLSVAVDHASRRQQAVEIWISPHENFLTAQTADQGFARRFDLPESIHILAVTPPIVGSASTDQPRRFLVYPGGAVPRIGIEIGTVEGRRRFASVDPLTGSARAEAVTP